VQHEAIVNLPLGATTVPILPQAVTPALAEAEAKYDIQQAAFQQQIASKDELITTLTQKVATFKERLAEFYATG
jgi:hypothetical protein